ncbi:DUF1702 family protein [Nonomuraea sediminis]|uniref:DUF1702 family protein n=1 Tax=Nonomuraea sediminis TaxID=2835864 RepID=UPI001BDBD1FC|nr:DUF1702 family protein [Nonomuraea sediminis]
MAPSRGLRRFLTKDPREADLSRRRFRLREGHSRRILESAEESYIFGFNATLARETDKIELIEQARRGFAYEGAGAACTVLDLLTLTRGRRLHELLAGPAKHHRHSVYLGAGRGYALLRLHPMRGLRRAHPLLRWLVVDGFGFQQGLTRADRMVGERSMPDLLTRSHCAIFDQGLGRLLWYHDCAQPDEVAARIAGYPVGRRGDLWSGAGFAAAYTGGADLEELQRLAAHAGADGFRGHLAQGCAFAVTARAQAGPVPEHTAEAADVLAGAVPEEAASWADAALIALGHDPHTHEDYQTWHAGVRRAWARRNR